MNTQPTFASAYASTMSEHCAHAASVSEAIPKRQRLNSDESFERPTKRNRSAAGANVAGFLAQQQAFVYPSTMSTTTTSPPSAAATTPFAW
eukprot:CAMPEP_0198116098 /NCGR_PEP_ID=MMETSP1442-20131203/9452_1 /TAXON_ID= /ORGANISM="Craspedostauros australis, Strain CCMP3328" /LENGTH=90 /DNA_ID=CAMNT_0043773791 /DNA_START=83 /DNA_END=352 /DNA_ORIENTATION=+